MQNMSKGYDGGAGLVDERRERCDDAHVFQALRDWCGLRVGWGYGPQHVVDVLNRLRGPFNLSNAALAAAEAAVRDTRLGRQMPG